MNAIANELTFFKKEMDNTRPLFDSFLVVSNKCEKLSIQYPVFEFKPTTLLCESSPITTKPPTQGNELTFTLWFIF